MFKLQISSIFHFDRAHQSWISGLLGVKYLHDVGCMELELVAGFDYRLSRDNSADMRPLNNDQNVDFH